MMSTGQYSNSRINPSDVNNSQPRCFQELIDIIVAVPQDFTQRLQETSIQFQHSYQNDEYYNELNHADESISQLKVIAMYLANKVVEIRSKHDEEIEFLQQEIAASKDEDAVYKDYYGVYQEMEERHSQSQKLNAELEEKCDQYLYKITTLYQAMESAQNQNKLKNRSDNGIYQKEDQYSISLQQQQQQQQQQEHELDNKENQGSNRNECNKCLTSNWEIERLNKELADSKEVIETLRKRLSQMFVRKKKPMKEKIKEQINQGMVKGYNNTNNPRNIRKNTVQLDSHNDVEYFQGLEQKQQLRQRLEDYQGEILLGNKKKNSKRDNQLLRESVLDSLMKVTTTTVERDNDHRKDNQKDQEEEENNNDYIKIINNDISKLQQQKEVFLTENDLSPDEMEQEEDRIFMTEGDATYSNDNNNNNKDYDLTNGVIINDRRSSFASNQENNGWTSNSSTQHLRKSLFQVDSEDQMKKSKEEEKREGEGGERKTDLAQQEASEVQFQQQKGQQQQQQQMQYLQVPQLKQRQKHPPSLSQFNLMEAQLQLEQTSILSFQQSNAKLTETPNIIYPPIIVVPASPTILPDDNQDNTQKPLNINTNSIIITNTNSNTIQQSSQLSLSLNNSTLPAVPMYNCTQPQLKSLFEELDEFTRQSFRVLTPQRSRSNSQNKAASALFSLSSSYKTLQDGATTNNNNNNNINNTNNNSNTTKEIAQLYQQPEKDEIIEKKPSTIPPFTGYSENTTPKMAMLQFKKMVPSQLNQTSPLQNDQQESLDRLFKKIDKEDNSGLKMNSMSCIVRDFNRKNGNSKLQNTRQAVTCFISPHATSTSMTTSATNKFNEEVLQRLLQQTGKISQSNETKVQKLQIGQLKQLLNMNESKIEKSEVIQQSQIKEAEQLNGQNNSQGDKEEEEEKKNWVPEDNNSRDNNDFNLPISISRERIALSETQLVSQLDQVTIARQRVFLSQEKSNQKQQNQQEELQNGNNKNNLENKEIQVISKNNRQLQMQQLNQISMTFTQWIILLILFPIMQFFKSIFKRK